MSVLDDPFEEGIVLIGQFEFAADVMAVIFYGIAAEVEGVGDLQCGFFLADEAKDAQLCFCEEAVGLEEGFTGLVTGVEAGDDQLYPGEQLGLVDGFYDIVGGVGGGGFFDDGVGLVGGDIDDLEGIAPAKGSNEVDAGEFVL